MYTASIYFTDKGFPYGIAPKNSRFQIGMCGASIHSTLSASYFMQLSKDVSSRIAMLRPILIIGVVFVHIAGVSDVPSEVTPGVFNWFVAFFKNGVFRGSVPTMSLIAGYLLFSGGLDQNPRKLFKKKFATLAIPFVIFNLYCLAFMAGMNMAFGGVFPYLPTLWHSPGPMLTYTLGIDQMPINGPLHFVRDMLVTIMLVPLLTIFLRKAPWIGLGGLALFFGLDFDGALIFRATSLLLFYTGGAAAIYQWNLLFLDKYAKECLAIFVSACLLIIGFRVDDNTLLVTIAPFMIWPSVSLLKNTRIEARAIAFSKYSFFIFAAHMPIVDSAWWAVTHHARWIPYPVYWVATPVLTVILLKYVYDFAVAVAPQAFNFAIGARAVSPLFIDRRRALRPMDAPVYSAEMRMALAGH